MAIDTITDKNYKGQQVLIPQYIHRPDLQSGSQRSVFGAITAMGLTVWIYLFVPILSLLAWWFGYHRFNQYIMHDYQHGFTRHLPGLVATVIILGLFLLTWASYNILRFYNKERRHPMPDATQADIANFYELDTQIVQQAQQAQISVFFYDRQGKIVNIAFAPHPTHAKD